MNKNNSKKKIYSKPIIKIIEIRLSHSIAGSGVAENEEVTGGWDNFW